MGSAAKEQELRKQLGAFGIKSGLATQPLASLSGGQAVRVQLAAIALSSPHLLVLVRCRHPRLFPCLWCSQAWTQCGCAGRAQLAPGHAVD